MRQLPDGLSHSLSTSLSIEVKSLEDGRSLDAARCPPSLATPFFFYQKQSSGLHLIKKRKRKAHPTSYETESLSKVGITGGRGKLTPLIPLYKFTYTMKLYKKGYMNTLRSQQTSSSLAFQNNHLIERWRCQDLYFVFCLTAPASSTL